MKTRVNDLNVYLICRKIEQLDNLLILIPINPSISAALDFKRCRNRQILTFWSLTNYLDIKQMFFSHQKNVIKCSEKKTFSVLRVGEFLLNLKPPFKWTLLDGYDGTIDSTHAPTLFFIFYQGTTQYMNLKPILENLCHAY